MSSTHLPVTIFNQIYIFRVFNPYNVHFILPVDGNGHECEDGDGHGEVRYEVVDGAVHGAKNPIPEKNPTH